MRSSPRTSTLLVANTALLGLALSLPSAGGSPPARQCSRMLFVRHCAPCHGPQGLGDGPASALLDPKPRDFSTGRFRLISTANELPTAEDVYRVITDGIVGSAMPPHDELSEQQRRGLAGYVRDLVVAGRARVLQELAQEDGETLPWESAVEEALLPEPVTLPVPAAPAPTPQRLAHGRELYDENCASCHDTDGRGRSRDDLVDEKGRPTSARDITAGVLKGGQEPEDVFRRIRCGMPGSAMPSFELPDEDAWDLTLYVVSLIRPGARARVAQERALLRARPVEGRTLPEAPGAATWEEVESRWLPLAPLAWSPRRIPGVQVQVARDARHLGLRLRWSDAPGASSGASARTTTVRVRFSTAAVPTFMDPGRSADSEEEWEWTSELGDFDYAPLGVTARSTHGDGRHELVFLRDLSIHSERIGMGAADVGVAFEVERQGQGETSPAVDLTIWHRLSR